MTEQELIEVWRSEFESTIDKPHLLNKFPSGTYSWGSTEWMWAGFQRAKRSQPVVVLPKPTQSDGFRYWTEMDIDHALTAAGIQFKAED